MAKDQARMPMSTAGLQSFHDEYRSSIEIKPGHVIVLGIIVVFVIAALHLFGANLLA